MFELFVRHQLTDAYGLLIAWMLVARATLGMIPAQESDMTHDWLLARIKDTDALVDTIEISRDAFL